MYDQRAGNPEYQHNNLQGTQQGFTPKKKIINQYENVTIFEIEDNYTPIYNLHSFGNINTEYGKLEPLLKDDYLEEVMYINPDSCVIVYHREHGMCDTNIFMTEEEIMDVINWIADFVGKEINEQNTLLDARLPDGSRVNATVHPASPDTPSLTIRKFRKDPFTIVDLIKFGTLSSEVAAQLWIWVEGLQYKAANTLVSGGTGSGKTTTLNVLAMFIPKELRLLTIEDTAELRFEHDHWLRLEAVPPSPDVEEVSINDLLRNSLRMRPDRIVVGEVRSKEASTMFTAMNTGHDGTLGTIHANTAQETVTRLTSSPMLVPSIMLRALDIILMQSRLTINGKPVRRITEIAEVGGLEKDRPRLNLLYKWDSSKNQLVSTGAPSKLREVISQAAGISYAEYDAILQNRKQILDHMVANNYRTKEMVANIVQNYYLKIKNAQPGETILEQNERVTIKHDGYTDMNTYIVHNIIDDPSYGKLISLLEDEDLEEIMFNNSDECVKIYHRKHDMCDTNIFLTEDEVIDIITRIGNFVGKQIDNEHPIFDGRLPDGSRVNSTLPPASPDGPTLTIRKFKKDPLTLVDLIKFKTIDSNIAALMWMWVEGLGHKPLNILVAGGTSCGKTTTLNIMAMYIPEEERILTIEDTLELQLEHEHWIQLESVAPSQDGTGKVTIDDLLKNTLRMRPDRIIVGEVRGPEAKTMFTAMNTGHDGSLGTVHANTALDTVTRLTNPPMEVPPIMMKGLDLIIMQQRMTVHGKAVRRITEIAEMGGLEKGKPRLNTIYKWDPHLDVIKPTGVPSKLREKICKAAGISLQEFDATLQNRKQIIDYMIERNMRDQHTVMNVLQNYYQKVKGVEQGERIIDQYDSVTIRSIGTSVPTYNVNSMEESSSYGKLTPLFNDDRLEDVMYNGSEECVKVYHRDHAMCNTNIMISEDEIISTIYGIASYVDREINIKNPLLDGRLHDGSRINATIPPASPDGPTLTVRKFRKDPLTIVDLIKFGTITPKVAAFLWICVEGLQYKSANILIAGGGGCGKTSTLNILGMFIPKELRVVSIEDTAELQLGHEHWLRLESVLQKPDGTGEVTIDQLLKNTLRMRPDRTLVGDVRGAEAKTLFTAMNTGHDGCMGTVHANSANETITRLSKPPMDVPPIMLVGLDLVVMQQHMTIDGKAVRRITEISEIGGLERDRPRINTIFKWDYSKRMLVETGSPSKLRETISKAAGISSIEYDAILENRRQILEYMVANNYRTKEMVTNIIQNYYLKIKNSQPGETILEQNDKVILKHDGNKDLNTYLVNNIGDDPSYGKLISLLEDDELEEIMFNSSDECIKMYHRKHDMCDTNIFLSNDEVLEIINKIGNFVGKRIDSIHPIFDGRLPDGSRVNATLPPASPDGPTLTIRKFRKDPLTIVDLINYKTLDPKIAALMWMWVEGLGYKPLNILVAGGTSCGKTTTLNIMAMFIPAQDRVLTIEDTLELQLEHEHWLQLESVPTRQDGTGEVTLDDLLKNTLRMRPDRIIVGEVRGPEAKTMFTAMNTGHDGSLGTVHANTALDTITRLTNPPMEVPPIMMTGLDLIIMQQRMTVHGKAVRRITEIAEMGGLEKGKPRLNTVFKWDPHMDIIKQTGVPSKLREKICRSAGITMQEFDTILQNRQQIIEYMVAGNMRDIVNITKVIQNYYEKMEEMKKARPI